MDEFGIYLKVPEGWMPSGEYRPPRMHEYYLAIDSSGDWSIFTASRDHKDDAQIIMKEVKRGKKKK